MVAEPFSLIAITPPGFVMPREVQAVVGLIDSGRFQRVHIRKYSRDDAVGLLRALPARIYGCLSLHDARKEDVEEFQGIGVHLTARMPVQPDGFDGILSRSCHSISEAVDHASRMDYVFLSPVFDSISKQGYKAAFSIPELNAAGAGGSLRRVVALGGVTPDKIDMLRRMGFAGAAMLGAAWPPF